MPSAHPTSVRGPRHAGPFCASGARAGVCCSDLVSECPSAEEHLRPAAAFLLANPATLAIRTLKSQPSLKAQSWVAHCCALPHIPPSALGLVSPPPQPTSAQAPLFSTAPPPHSCQSQESFSAKCSGWRGLLNRPTAHPGMAGGVRRCQALFLVACGCAGNGPGPTTAAVVEPATPWLQKILWRAQAWRPRSGSGSPAVDGESRRTWEPPAEARRWRKRHPGRRGPVYTVSCPKPTVGMEVWRCGLI